MLYAISLFIVRCTCMCFQMSGFQLAASWFIRYRGRVLGIITLGSPLFSVIGTSVMTNFISNNLGGDYRPFYYSLCIVLVIHRHPELLPAAPRMSACSPTALTPLPRAGQHRRGPP